MARIAGVDIPRNKRVEIALTYIYGIGNPTSQKILKEAGVNFDTRVKDLTEEEVTTAIVKYKESHIAEIFLIIFLTTFFAIIALILYLKWRNVKLEMKKIDEEIKKQNKKIEPLIKSYNDKKE